MRVKVWVETWAEADVRAEDLLPELVAEIGPEETMLQIQAAITRSVQLMRAIPEDTIKQMSPEARKIIAQMLTEQIERYK